MRWLKEEGAPTPYPELSKQLKNRSLDALRSNWCDLAEYYLDAWRAAMPPRWSSEQPTVDRALDRTRHARNNSAGSITEVRRVMQ